MVVNCFFVCRGEERLEQLLKHVGMCGKDLYIPKNLCGHPSGI